MRDEKITIAKAIAIMLMVICHAGLPHVGGQFVTMFHMPLFFFVSGYCFKDKYLNDVRQFSINKVKGLYVPFVKWSLLFLVLHNVFFHLNIYNDVCGWKGVVSLLYGWKDVVKNVAKIVLAMNETEQLLGGYWFLKELFLGSFLALGCFKYLKNNFLGASILLLIAIVMSWFDVEVPSVHIASRTFFAGFFIVMGRAYKRMNVDADKWPITIMAFIIVSMGSVWCGTSMLSYSAIQILPYSVCAILGTIMILNLSHRLSLYQNWAKRFLMFVGDHTLEVLTWHFLSFKLVSLLIIWVYALPIEQLAGFPIIKGYSLMYWPLYSFVGICVPIGALYIRKRLSYERKTK